MKPLLILILLFINSLAEAQTNRDPDLASQVKRIDSSSNSLNKQKIQVVSEIDQIGIGNEEKLNTNQKDRIFMSYNYNWDSLKGKVLTFTNSSGVIKDNEKGFDNFYMRKDLQVSYALNDIGKSNPTELIGKKFKVLNVTQNYRNRKSELGILLFLENLTPSSFMHKQCYYMYIPESGQVFVFNLD